jgi:hypothetical protein
VICLYTKNDLTEKEKSNTIPFTKVSKEQTQKIGTNLPKMLRTSTMKIRQHRREIEEYTERWKDLPCSWMSRIHIMKMAILFSYKMTYRFKETCTKILVTFFTELEETI